MNLNDFPEMDKTFVEGSSTSDTGTGSYPPDPNAPAFASGELPSGNEPIPLGSGKIVLQLGAGGMARVYKIWNEHLEVFRAVKVLIPSAQGDRRQRFDTEAKITAKLQHPNIINIFTVGEWNNLPYLEMEFVDGSTLEDIINSRGRLPLQVCTALSILVARALAYAHRQKYLLYGKTYEGIIHRDLKPANIMLTRQGEVKLMDFGIARPTEASFHTADGNVVGTLQYLAPEQMDGLEIDNRSDIYAFGAILYEMLTGTKTFPQNTITNLLKGKALNKYRHIAEFDYPVPPKLSKIVEKCLEADRGRRFKDAEALLDALQDAHGALHAPPPETLLRTFCADPDSLAVGERKNSLRLPKWTLPAAGVLAAVAVLTVGGITLMRGIGKPEDAKQASASTETSPPSQTADKGAEKQQEKEEPEQQKEKEPAVPSRSAPVVSARPVRKPQRTVSTPPPVRPKPARKPRPAPKPLSPEEKLQKEYAKDDLFEIAEIAYRKGAYDDALTALNGMKDGQGNGTQKTLYLLASLWETGKLTRMQQVAASSRLNDAWYDLLTGQLAQKQGNTEKALRLFQSALTKPSALRSRMEIRNDALFFTAQVRDHQYRSNPSGDTRLQAMTAWNNLKRCYQANPGHPRFVAANKKLATIR
jgi:serine/threonine protein kinase